MRILHFIQRYAPAQGGAEIHLGVLSQRLAADGHEVVVATTDALDYELFWNPTRPRIQESQSVIDGVEILRFPVRHPPLAPTSYRGLRRLLWIMSRLPLPTAFAGQLSRLTPWVPDLWRWLARTDRRFDLVAGMNISFEPFMAAGLKFAQRRQLPFVIYPLTHLGAGEQPGADEVSSFHTMRHQITIVQASDVIIAQTEAEKLFYQRQGVAPERIHIVGPGVTPTAIIGGSGRRIRDKLGLTGPIVLSITALSYDKGTAHLIEAMQQLWAVGCKAHLVLAGAIPASFQKYLAKWRGNGRAHLHILGPVSDDDKRDLLAAADLFALPSRTDSFGIVYLEAWLNQMPVIGADAWGIRDVIAAGEDGLLVPFGDVAALADAITKLLNNPTLAQSLAQKGNQKTRQHHTWDHKYEQIRHIYHQAVR